MDDTEIEIDGYTIDMTSADLSAYNYSTFPTITVSTAGALGSAGGPYITTGNGYNWGTLNASTSLDVKGDATFEGDIKWQGRSLGKLLETIENRLAILQEPSPEKLEKYAALKKAYEHYKTLERLIGED
jgi:hypothetical protein